MICAAASPSFQSIFRKLTHGLSAISLSVFYSCAAICQTSTSHKKLSLRLKLPDQSPPSIPLLWVWLRASVHITVLSSTAEGGEKGEEEKKACWCFTGILLKGENDVKRRKQSCLWYIYTIGCKSFLMGSRVQSWGRDYQGRSGSGMTCICPDLALWTPPRCTLACWGQVRAWVWPGCSGLGWSPDSGTMGVAKTARK